MKFPFRLALLAASILTLTLHVSADPALTVIGSFPDQEVTGIGGSKKSGRVFVNFPHWSDKYKFAVAELMPDGKLTPFPDKAWNATTGDPAKHFICVQSVVVDDEDHLWVLDPASVKMDGVTPGGAKVVEIDLAKNKVMRVYSIPDEVAPKLSYLNDIRLDLPNKTAYMTESGVGSLVVLDLASGQSRAVLRGQECTHSEPGITMTIDGMTPIDVKTGTPPNFNADGIALDAGKGLLYFHPLTGYGLYKIATADLRNPALTDKELVGKVTKMAETAMPDGMLEAPDGTVMLTNIENDSVDRFDPGTGKVTTVVKDERLQWPDTMSWGPDGWLYVTASQIHRQPSNNAGVSKQKGPYLVFKLQPPPKP